MDPKDSEATKENKSLKDTECAICLQSFAQPVMLPCKHIFCFLCAKGLVQQNNKCAMCRKVIPQNVLNNLQFVADQKQTQLLNNSYKWFYEGTLGWWQYDDQTNAEIEDACASSEQQCEVLIAGSLYVIDFQRGVQYKKSNPGCRRRIKRDLVTVSKKGVAGIYQKCDSATSSCSPSCSTSLVDSCSNNATSSSSNNMTSLHTPHATGNLVNLSNVSDANDPKSDVVVLSESTSSKASSSQVNSNDQPFVIVEEILTVDDDDDTVTYNIPNSSKKRKRAESSDILAKTDEKLEMKDDVYNAFGVVVVSKLHAMNNVQRIYAEKIINDTLFQGLLGKLTADSHFTS